MAVSAFSPPDRSDVWFRLPGGCAMISRPESAGRPRQEVHRGGAPWKSRWKDGAKFALTAANASWKRTDERLVDRLDRLEDLRERGLEVGLLAGELDEARVLDVVLLEAAWFTGPRRSRESVSGRRPRRAAPRGVLGDGELLLGPLEAGSSPGRQPNSARQVSTRWSWSARRRSRARSASKRARRAASSASRAEMLRVSAATRASLRPAAAPSTSARRVSRSPRRRSGGESGGGGRARPEGVLLLVSTSTRRRPARPRGGRSRARGRRRMRRASVSARTRSVRTSLAFREAASASAPRGAWRGRRRARSPSSASVRSTVASRRRGRPRGARPPRGSPSRAEVGREAPLLVSRTAVPCGALLLLAGGGRLREARSARARRRGRLRRPRRESRRTLPLARRAPRSRRRTPRASRRAPRARRRDS